jgi:fermentation-respiration switch protein FrsA (DUF1100 family)
MKRIEGQRRRVSSAALLCLGLAACTSVFYRPNNSLYHHPDQYDLAYETPRFKTEDGVTITSLLLKARAQPLRGIVVHFHGNAGNLTGHFPYAHWLVDYGFDVLTFDYRGYGNTKGRPSPEGLVRDGTAALRHAAQRAGERNVPILVLGQSLGGAVAVVAIARESSLPIRAVALDSPFSSYRSVAKAKLRTFWLTRIFARPFVSLLVSDAASPLRAIRDRPICPLVLIHGTADRVVPYAEGRRLFEAAPPPKILWTIEGGDHVEAFTRFGDEYKPRLAKFFLDAVSAPISPETTSRIQSLAPQ